MTRFYQAVRSASPTRVLLHSSQFLLSANLSPIGCCRPYSSPEPFKVVAKLVNNNAGLLVRARCQFHGRQKSEDRPRWPHHHIYKVYKTSNRSLVQGRGAELSSTTKKLQAAGWRGEDCTSQSEVLTEISSLAGTSRGNMCGRILRVQRLYYTNVPSSWQCFDTDLSSAKKSKRLCFRSNERCVERPV
jgi:hypothetical protein